MMLIILIIIIVNTFCFVHSFLKMLNVKTVFQKIYNFQIFKFLNLNKTKSCTKNRLQTKQIVTETSGSSCPVVHLPFFIFFLNSQAFFVNTVV